MTAKEDCKEVLRHELEASETLDRLTREHPWEDIDSSFVEVGAQLVSDAEDPQRKKTILIILARIGQSTESTDIVRFAKEHLEDWQDKYE